MAVRRRAIAQSQFGARGEAVGMATQRRIAKYRIDGIYLMCLGCRRRCAGSAYPSKVILVAEILIHCPLTGESVSTGLDTATIVFESLPPVLVPLECPSCRQTHHWKPADAWVKGETMPQRRWRNSN